MANIGGKYFAAKPGRYGTQPEMLTVGSSLNILNPAFLSVSAATLSWMFPTPYRKMCCLRFSAATRVVPGSATATAVLTCTIRKISGGATTNLTSALELSTLTANVSKPFVTLSTLAPSNLILQEGDILIAFINNTATVTTLPVDLSFTAEVTPAE